MTSERVQLVATIKLSTVIVSTLILSSCATPHSEWDKAGYYVTNESVYGCDSFEGRKGTVVEKTAIPSLSLQRRLLYVLDQAASADEKLHKELDEYRDQLMCWYETPEHNMELSLGGICDGPFQIEFRPQGGDWSVAFAERAMVECMPSNASLERTRER